MKMLKFISQKVGFGFGRHRVSKWLKDSKGPWSAFGTIMTIRLSFLKATIWWLKELHTVKCLKNLGLEAKPPADVSATCLSFEMAEYLAWTSISISTIQERIEHGLDGARIVTGDVLNPHCFGSRTRPLRVRRTTEGAPDLGKKLIVGAACSLVSRPVIKELLDSGLETTSRSRSSQNPWGS
jgi:hypothetical protein